MTLFQFGYASIDGNDYAVNVFNEDYQEPVFYKPNGRATLSYPNVKDFMTVARGCEMDVQLEINQENFGLIEELASITGDRKARGRLFKNGQIIFEGYLRPDSISYPLNTEYIIISLSFTDGLGLLDGTEYRNTDGTEYRGVENELIQLSRVLKLTGSNLNFRIYDLGLYFRISPTQGSSSTDNKPIEKTYTNQDRYRNNDQENSVFDCLKVLEGILKKYGCCIYQHQNKWHITRINMFTSSLYNGANASFKEYNSDGVLVLTSTLQDEGIEKNITVGSQVGGYNPFFCNANQNIKLNGTLGAYKVYYEYGVLKSTFLNSEMIFSNTVGDIDGWNVEDNSKLVYLVDETPLRALIKDSYPTLQNIFQSVVTGEDFNAYKLIDANADFNSIITQFDFFPYFIINTTTGRFARVLEVENETTLRLSAKLTLVGDEYIVQRGDIETNEIPVVRSLSSNDEVYDQGVPLKLTFSGYTLTQPKQTTDYPVEIKIIDVSDPNNVRYLSNDLNWSSSEKKVVLIEKKTVTATTTKNNFNIDLSTETLPFDCTVQITLFTPANYIPEQSYDFAGGILYNNILVAPDVEAPQIKGESFTSRFADSKIGSTKNELQADFFTGDSDADVYVGSIQDENGNTVVDWKRLTGVLPTGDASKLLNIIAYERLTLQNKNQKEFSGSIRGFVPYLGVYFMPEIDATAFNPRSYLLTSYTYDTRIEQVSIKAVSVIGGYFTPNNDVIVDFNLESDEIIEPKVIG